MSLGILPSYPALHPFDIGPVVCSNTPAVVGSGQLGARMGAQLAKMHSHYRVIPFHQPDIFLCVAPRLESVALLTDGGEERDRLQDAPTCSIPDLERHGNILGSVQEKVRSTPDTT